MTETSYTDLSQRLAALDAEREEIAAEMAAKRKERRKELLREIREKVEAEGFSLEEVITGRTPAAAAKAESWPLYQLNADPSKSYRRGRLPDWMREMMREHGLDPRSAEDRDRFKAEHMTRA